MDETIRKDVEPEIPQIIRRVGFDFRWSNPKVWKLKAPVSRMKLKTLEWHFDIPFLEWNGGAYNLKPGAVLHNPKKYAVEWNRTMRADLKHPVDIMRNKGRWLVLDGLHRLMKLYAQGETTVRVRKIPRSMVPRIVK